MVKISANVLTKTLLISFMYLVPVIYSETVWEVNQITDDKLMKGSYDIYGNRSVWQAFDGNDMEIFYRRSSDRIVGERYNLKMICGNGSSYQMGGITKVGGYRRQYGVCNDYEGLCRFDLSSFSGKIKKTKLLLFFEKKCKQSSGYANKCSYKKIIVYDENKGPWDPKTVNYNSFSHCPWNKKIGEIKIPSFNINRTQLQNAALKALVQRWVDDPSTNDGLVLTSDLGNKCSYFKIIRVVLIVSFEDRIMQLTDNDINEYDPKIYKNRIVWGAYDGTDSEIFYWNGTKVVQLTDNELDEYSPQIYGKRIVWERFNGTNWIINLWENGEVKDLTNNSIYDNYKPRIYKKYVTWYGYDGYDDEVFFYDGKEKIQITDNDYNDLFPVINGSRIAWQSNINLISSEVFRFDILTNVTDRLTNNTIQEASISLSGDKTLWAVYDNVDWEIEFNNNLQNIQITDNDVHDLYPSIDGDNIVWSSGSNSSSNFDIFHYDCNTGLTTNLSNNDLTDFYPMISKDFVIWNTFKYDSILGLNYSELFIAKKKKVLK